MGEIQRADPAALRLKLLVLGCAAVAGVVLISLACSFRPAFAAWAEEKPRARFRLVMEVAILLTSGPLFGLASYLWHFGRRIRRAERYPPPGFRVMRDTPVATGEAARRHGSRVQILAVLIAVAAVLSAVSLWRLRSLMSA
jgi:hypothetical protein